MYHVRDSIHLDLTLGDFKVPNKMLSFGGLLLTSDLVGSVPLMQLEISDQNGALKKKVDLEDGITITINVGKSADDQVEYNFRLFNVKEQASGASRFYKITGYLDVPAYLAASTNKHFVGTTSSVIEEVAKAAGVAALQADATADSQTWYQANKRNGEFVRYLAQHGYASDGSVMVCGMRFDKTLLYKDFNSIEGEECVFARVPAAGSKDVQILDYRAIDRSGSMNFARGYSDTLVAQQMDTEKSVTHKNSKVLPRAKNVAQNAKVKGAINSSRVAISPAYHKDMAHENFFKAEHQNVRGQFANSIMLDVLTPQQLNPIDLLSPVSVRLRNVGQGEDNPDSARDGSYIVVAKHIVVNGLHYAEKYRLLRAGTNSSK